MDDSLSQGLDSKITKELEAEIQASKRRKLVEKTVVTVKIEANEGKQRSEGPPSDCWSWRKYGQKPIKGSPYPRGYYRCSTSKGCSAKKQVERCRTDASMVIITYTSTHNHDLPISNLAKPSKQPKPQIPTFTRKKEEEEEEEEETNVDHFHYSQSPFNNSDDIIVISQQENNPFADEINEHPPSVLLLDEEPLCNYPPLMALSSSLKSEEENDFYDELEELPSSSSSSSSFLRTDFFDDRILVHPF